MRATETQYTNSELFLSLIFREPSSSFLPSKWYRYKLLVRFPREGEGIPCPLTHTQGVTNSFQFAQDCPSCWTGSPIPCNSLRPRWTGMVTTSCSKGWVKSLGPSADSGRFSNGSASTFIEHLCTKPWSTKIKKSQSSPSTGHNKCCKQISGGLTS